MKRIIVLVMGVVLSGCAQWIPARYSEVEPGVYQLSATGNSFSSRKDLQEKIDDRATKLCLPRGYSYPEPADYTFHTQNIYIDGRKTASNYRVLKRVAVCHDIDIKEKSLKSALFLAKCEKQETERGDKNAKEYCKCAIKENPSLSVSKIPKAHYACKQLSTIKATVVEPTIKTCSEFLENKDVEIGDVVQLYRTFIDGKWVDGVKPSFNGVVWRLKEHNEKGVFLDLVKGNYGNLKAGDTKRIGDTEYQYYNPKSGLGDGIMKSLVACKA